MKEFIECFHSVPWNSDAKGHGGRVCVPHKIVLYGDTWYGGHDGKWKHSIESHCYRLMFCPDTFQGVSTSQISPKTSATHVSF